MGTLEDGHIEEELGNGVGLEPEAESTREIEEAVRVLLRGLGEDQEREGLRKTPLRVAKAFRDGTRGYKQKVKEIVQGALFPEAGLENGTGCAGGSGGLVVVRDIDLFSYCESCLLPFGIRCHVGYIPSGQRVVGLSKLSRVADVFAKRLQEPQRLAGEVCSALHHSIQPSGVAVALQCWHIQFPESIRSSLNPTHPSKLDRQGWLRTSVCSSSGVFQDASRSSWNDFLALLKFKGISIEGGNSAGSPIQCWCPSRSLEVPLSNGNGKRYLSNGRIPSKAGASQSAMITAVSKILQSLGEDPSRKELLGTPCRFVQWLMKFKKSNLEMMVNGFGLSKISLYETSVRNVGCEFNEIHSELNLPFCAQCEHHLLPFYGMVHVGFFGSEEGRAVDRSSLESLVQFYACQLQVQERLTRQIAEAVYSVFKKGVMVVIEASHICMISRGIEKVGSSTATIAVMGQFSADSAAKAMFLQTISESTASG